MNSHKYAKSTYLILISKAWKIFFVKYIYNILWHWFRRVGRQESLPSKDLSDNGWSSKIGLPMDLFAYPCPCCARDGVHVHTHYSTQAHGSRTILHCRQCDVYFSETFATYWTTMSLAGYVCPCRATSILRPQIAK